MLIPLDHSDRKTRILDAAERCFVRAGFHRTTMQDIAIEAGMSAGNLYRYFASKDGVVEGLCLRDRQRLAGDFEALEGAEDFMATFVALGRKHFEEEPRDKAVLCLQIWSEAARSETVARYAADFAEDVIGRFEAVFRAAQGAGSVARDLDCRAAATLIATLADGLFVRRAIMPAFDPAREVTEVVKLICAIVSGHIPGLCVRPVSETNT